MIDAATIKATAAGRWPEILVSLGGCPAEVLDGRHHACPRCGGRDRFRLIDAAAGAVYCNQCFNTNNGDGLAALGWLRGWQFKQTVTELGNYLAVNGDGDGRVGGDGRPRTNKSPKTYPSAREAVASLDSRVSKTDQGWRVAWWTYTDGEGDPVAVVVRYDLPTPEGEKQRKTFRPVSKHGDGWRWGDPLGQWPLYQLPDLAAAEVVYVLEGEKSADAAASIGLTATTSPHGSKSAGKADWSPLAGKRVVILPDRDVDGERYASDVAEIVTALKPPATTKIVRLPGLPTGGDIVEWIEAQGDAAEPEELCRQIEALADEAEVAKSIQPKASAPEILGRAPTILPWRPFPVDALPEPVCGFVAAGAKAIGCDASYIALPLLAALASAIGATRRIKLKPGWVEPCVIWTATVGESGTLKSPGKDRALDALERFQAWKLEEYPKLMEQYERDKLLYEADLAEWKRKGRKAGEPPPEKPEEPVVQRYLVNDVTVEALADRLQHAPRGLLAAGDELGVWLGSFDQYRSGRGGDVNRWLSIHRAGPLLVDRKTGATKTIFVKRAAVSVTGTITPGALSRALGLQHIENGLAARLLLALPPRHSKRWTEATVAPELVRQVEKLFGRLLVLHFGTDAEDAAAPIDLPLAPDGKAAWVAFYNQHATTQQAATGALAAAFSKLEGYAARFALIVHLVRCAADDPTLGDPERIDGRSIGIGTTLAKWFAGEAERLYGMLGESEEDRDQRRLLELIERKGGSVTPRDLMRSSSRYPVAEDAEAALGKLVKLGIGRWEPVDHAGRRGRPTMRFRLTDSTDIDANTAKPEENTNCVSVSAVSEAENTEPINAPLSEAAAEDTEEWLVL